MTLDASQVMLFPGGMSGAATIARYDLANSWLTPGTVRGIMQTTTNTTPSQIPGVTRNNLLSTGRITMARAHLGSTFNKVTWLIPLGFDLPNTNTAERQALARTSFQAIAAGSWDPRWPGSPPASGNVLDYYKQAATEQATRQPGMTHYWRLGPEFNGAWSTWGIGGANAPFYVSAFRAVVNAVRSLGFSNIKFDWNPSLGPYGGNPAATEAAWPGDSYVDVVGIDMYHRPARSGGPWLINGTVWQNEYGRHLDRLRDFAIAHGAQISFPEWACGGPHVRALEWLRRAALWMDDLPSSGPGSLAYHCWFSDPQSREGDTVGGIIVGYHDIIDPERSTISPEYRLIETRDLFADIFGGGTIPSTPFPNSDVEGGVSGPATITLARQNTATVARPLVISPDTITLARLNTATEARALTVTSDTPGTHPTVSGVAAMVSATTGTVTPALPAAVSTGDLLFLVVAGRPWTTGTDPAVAGWSAVASRYVEVGSIDLQLMVFSKVAEAGEVAPTITLPGPWSGGSRGLSAFIVAVRDGGTVTATTSQQVTGAATWAQTPLTAVPAGSLVLDVVATAETAALALTTANNFEVVAAGAGYDTDLGSGVAVAVGATTLASAGTYSSPVWQQTLALTVLEPWAGIAISIAPSAAPPPPPVIDSPLFIPGRLKRRTSGVWEPGSVQRRVGADWVRGLLHAAGGSDLQQQLLADSTKAHEGNLAWVPDSFDWSHYPRIGYGNSPGPAGAWTAAVPWGQIYPEAGWTPTGNTRCVARRMGMAILSANSDEWVVLIDVPGSSCYGAYFQADFSGNAVFPEPLSTDEHGNPAGIPATGYNMHFFPNNRVAITPGDIAAVIGWFEARVEPVPGRPDDTLSSRFLAGAGGDWWVNTSIAYGTGGNNGDWAIGRHRFLTTEWQLFTGHTMTNRQIRKKPPVLSAPASVRTAIVSAATGAELNPVPWPVVWPAGGSSPFPATPAVGAKDVTATANFAGADLTRWRDYASSSIRIQRLGINATESTANEAELTRIGIRRERVFLRFNLWFPTSATGTMVTNPSPKFNFGDAWIDDINRRGVEPWITQEGLPPWLSLTTSAGRAQYKTALVRALTYIKGRCPQLRIVESWNEIELAKNGAGANGAVHYEVYKANAQAVAEVNALGLPGPALESWGPSWTGNAVGAEDEAAEWFAAAAADPEWDSIAPKRFTVHNFKNYGAEFADIDNIADTYLSMAEAAKPGLLANSPLAFSAYSQDTSPDAPVVPTALEMAVHASWYISTYLRWLNRTGAATVIEACHFCERNYDYYPNTLLWPEPSAGNPAVPWAAGTPSPLGHGYHLWNRIGREVGGSGKRVAVALTGDTTPIEFGIGPSATAMGENGVAWLLLANYDVPELRAQQDTVHAGSKTAKIVFTGLASVGISDSVVAEWEMWQVSDQVSNPAAGSATLTRVDTGSWAAGAARELECTMRGASITAVRVRLATGAGTQYANIAALGAAWQTSLGVGWTVVPNADGRSFTVTGPSGSSVPTTLAVGVP